MSFDLNRFVVVAAGTLSLQSMGSVWRDLQKVIGQFFHVLPLQKVGWTAAQLQRVSALSEYNMPVTFMRAQAGMTEVIISLLEYRLYYFQVLVYNIHTKEMSSYK